MNSGYNFRIGLMFLLLCCAYCLIVCNLYVIQIKRQAFFANLAKQQYKVTVKACPERALIYDRNGKALVVNKHSFSAFILPNKIASIETLEPFLKKHFPKGLERLYKNPNASFLYIKRKLSQAEHDVIERSHVPDLKLVKEVNRFYPNDSLAHIVGITNVDNIGLLGIELLHNKELAGTPTNYSLEKDARSSYFYFTRSTSCHGVSGRSLQMTVDADLQFLVREHLQEAVERYKAKEGIVLVMDPETGAILVMSQYPSFDPNNMGSLEDCSSKNKAATDVYELGSVMKVFVALAALQEGIVEQNEPIDCENTRTAMLKGVRVNTWRAQGVIPLCEVVQYSNNVGIAKVAMRLGPKLYEHYKRLGFGCKTGFVWPGQQAGFVNPPEKWSKLSIVSLSFGYELTASVIQLACAFSLIANGGYVVKSTLLCNEERSAKKGEKLYDDASLDAVRDILEKTVTQGTARRAALKGYRVMGKTGTANMVVDGAYSHEHNRYTFAGIVQKGAYKRVIVTYVQDADAAGKKLYASQVAAPLFEKVATTLLIHDKVV